MGRSCWLSLRIVALASFAVSAATLAAQTRAAQPPPDPPNFGSVSGHVYFAGSNAPARLVDVALQPLQVQLSGRFRPGSRPELKFTIYQTGLDGSYAIPQVAPGAYYVVVSEPGFLSPFTQFTPEQMAHPTPEEAHEIATTLPVVNVRPNAAATLDVQLQRGAGMSGSVRFDDGTPFVAARMDVQRHTSQGKWETLSSHSEQPTADADGHWQVSGLLPGEYRIRVELSLNDRKQSALVGNSSASSTYDHYALSYYSGDTARDRDIKTVKLEDNEQRNGEDLTIPVSKLHAVSGAVTDARTGQALNAGHVELSYADDGSYAFSTDIDPDTRTFTFNFVPEGEYKLAVRDAREVRLEPPPTEDYDPNFPNRNRRQVTLRDYGPGEMPLVVQGEMSGLNLPVPVKSKAP